MKHIKRFNESIKSPLALNTMTCSPSELEFDIEKRGGKVFILIQRKKAPEREYLTQYIITDETFEDIFVSVAKNKYDINEYSPIDASLTLANCREILIKMGLTKV